MTDHIVSRTTYVVVFGILIVLTVVTYAVAWVDMGAWNTPVALMIATVKAALVLLYFMHVRYSSRLTWLVLGACAIWLFLLIGGTLADVLTRSNVEMLGF